MKSTFRLSILTPEREEASCDAESLVVTLTDGQIQILPGHSPQVSPVAIGWLAYVAEGVRHEVCVTEGVLIVEPGAVTVLAGAIETSSEIDVERARSALERARKRVEETHMSWERERAEVGVKRALNRIEYAKRMSK
jgi:F-type H+-transporting ATPase subunit epsilon